MCLVCDFIFFIFVCFCGGSDSLAPNKDIVRSRCGGRDATLQSFEKGKERKFFKKTKKILYFGLVSGESCTILADFDLLYLSF